MKKMQLGVFTSVLACLMSTQAFALTVTVTIPPLASMVAPLLSADDKIEVLLQDGSSPHGFALRPSHLKAMQAADINLAVGSPVDAWAHKILHSLDDKTLMLNELPKVETLPFRQGGLWEKKVRAPAVHNEGHNHQDEPKQNDKHDDGHDHGHDHAKLSYDGHLWMSPINAKVMILTFSERLQVLQPERKAEIAHKTEAWLEALAQTEQQIAQQLAPIQTKPFMVLHDGFQYFEQYFGLNGVGSIRLNPEVQPSIKRVLQLRNAIKAQGVQCIFKEPQFPDKQVLSLAKQAEVKVGELDPMGLIYRQEGQRFVNFDGYLQGLANGFIGCLHD